MRARFHFDVPAGHLHVGDEFGGKSVRVSHDMERGQHGSQRRTEFVGQHREELILGRDWRARRQFLAARQGLLRGFEIGKIPRKTNTTPRTVPSGSRMGAAGIVDRNFGATVAADKQGVIGQPHDALELENFVHGAFDELASLFIDDAKDGGTRLIGGIGKRPAGELFGDRVHKRDAGVGVGDDHGIADAGEGDGQELLLLLDFARWPRWVCSSTMRR